MGIAAAMTNHEGIGPMQGKLAADALQVNPMMRSVFSALPPSHKANYPRWIEEAKMTDTRRRHIALMIERLTHEDAR
jgi:uncharacterized protein YdeI (YjbR/CyaY-like superfamily)